MKLLYLNTMSISKIKRLFSSFSIYTKILLILIAILMFATAVPARISYAQMSANDILSIKRETSFYDDGLSCAEGGTRSTQGAGLIQGSSVYIMGDSITAATENSYKAIFKNSGYIAEVNGLSSRSLGGSKPSPNGLQALDIDKDKITTAGAVVIALGTNSAPSKEQISSAVDKVRDYNKSAPIYWIDTAVVNRPDYAKNIIQVANEAIYSQAQIKSYQVISWFETVFPGHDPLKSSTGLKDGAELINTADGLNVHPTSKGIDKLSALVLEKLKGSGSALIVKQNSDIKFPLPATEGSTGSEQTINESGQLTSPDNNGSQGIVAFSQHAKLGAAYRDYYIAMRWTYAAINWPATSTKIVDAEQLKWLQDEPRIVLVTNPRTGKSIYAAALEYGPGPSVGTSWRANHNNSSSPSPSYWQGLLSITPPEHDGLVSGLPPKAQDALDVKTGYGNGGGGDKLTYQWAPDQTVTPGPTDQVAATTGGGDCTNGGTAGVNGWDLTSMVVYDQYDPKYANHQVDLGNSKTGTIKECGCGPTSLAMAVATLTGDKSVTPTTMADYYWNSGGLDGNCGSTWSFGIISKKWPSIKVSDLNKNLQDAIQTVKSGGFVIISVSGPPFTGGPDSNGNLPGHILLIRGVTEEGKILIANPLGKYAGSNWIDQNTTEWDPAYFSTQVNDKGGYLKAMYAITKE